MTTAFTPVRIGEFLIRDPIQFKAMFPNPEAYTAIMEYFPATNPRPIQSIPDDKAAIILAALKAAAAGLRSISTSQMSTVNGAKINKQSMQLIHIMAQMRKKDGDTGITRSSKKQIRKKVQTLSVDQKRALSFQLLWDLLHPTTTSEEVSKAWDTILEDSMSKDAFLRPMNPSTKLGTIDLNSLSGTEEKARAAFDAMPVAPTLPVSPSEQLKQVYGISELFGFDLNKIQQNKMSALVLKLKEILNEYAVYYSKRHSWLVTRIIDPFYKSLGITFVTEKLENDLLKLYDTISTATNDPKKLYAIFNPQPGTLLLKLPDIEWEDIKKLQKFIDSYTAFINTDAVANKDMYYIKKPGSTDQILIDTNEKARDQGGDSAPGRLFQLNTTDRFVIRIINGSQLKEASISTVPESYKAILTADVKDSINTECSAYFSKKNSQLFLVIHVIKNVVDRDYKYNQLIANMYTYTKSTGFVQGLPSLPKIGKVYTTLHKPNGDTLLDVPFQPDTIFRSMTLPVLQLFTLKHIRNKIDSKT